MSRFGFLLFNLLLVVFLYLPIYGNSAKTATIHYVLRSFSVPYVVLILLMLIISTVRWFMTHDPDIAREIVTWVNTLWFVPVMTVLALYLLGAINPNQFGANMHTLLR